MGNDFHIGIGVTPVVNEQEIQTKIDKQTKNTYVKASLEFDSSSKQLKSQLKQIQAVASSIGIKLDDKQAKNVLSNIRKEAKETAKELRNNIAFDTGKSLLKNNISSYLKNNTKLGKEFRLELIRIQSELDGIDAGGLNKLNKQFSAIKSEAKALGQVGDTVFSKLGKNASQFINYLGSATLVMSGIRGIKSMVSNVYELDTSMTSLYKVTDELDSKYNSFLVGASKNAKELGRSVSSLVEQSANWAKLGFDIDQSAELANVSSIYANVGEVDDDTAVSDIVTVLKSLNMEASDSIKIIDKLNAVSNNYAVTAADLGTGLSNSISAMNLAGNDLDQTIAMLTAMSEVTQDASESGNAIKVLSMRLRGAETDLEGIGEETDGLIKSASTLRNTIQSLTDVNGSGGFDIMLDDGNFKSTYEIMEGISKVWEDISNVDQANLLQIIAGKQRGNSIAALLKNMSNANDVLTTSVESSGSALAEQERYMESLEGKLGSLDSSVQSLSNTLINSDILKFFVDLGTNGVTAIDNLANSFAGLPVALSAISAIASTKNLGISNVKYALPSCKGTDAKTQKCWEENKYYLANAWVKTRKYINVLAIA